MTVSQQLRAVGGPAHVITHCQNQLQQLLNVELDTLNLSQAQKEQLVNVLSSKKARTIIGQAMLEAYAAGMAVGRNTPTSAK